VVFVGVSKNILSCFWLQASCFRLKTGWYLSVFQKTFRLASGFKLLASGSKQGGICRCFQITFLKLPALSLALAALEGEIVRNF